MNNEKQIEEMAEIIGEIDDNGYSYNEDGYEITGYANSNKIASTLVYKGYRKAEEVALETVDDFQCRLRHIFLDICEGNDYNTVNLLQIDSAIEALFDSFVSELKKKYTEDK